MERILICPGERPAVGFLAQTLPLVAVPILGESLVNCWMEWLANAGVKEVLVLATDRPELVRSSVGDGSRWGVCVQVESAMKELTEAEARAVLAAKARAGPAVERADAVIAMDHLPGLEELPLFRSYRDWFAAVVAWMSRSPNLDRIGARELEPRVWTGRRTQVASTARLRPPCWLGDHVQIGADAVIGPNAILEDRVIVDAAAEVESSLVGPDTFVGALTKLEGSIAWGNTLIDWRNGSCAQVHDPFLLCALGQRYLPQSRSGLWSLVTRPLDFFTRSPGRGKGAGFDRTR